MASNCVGLDIGSSSIKVVQLKETRKGLFLENFGIYPLPSGAIVDGAIWNQPAVLESIESLFLRLNIKKKDVAIAISGKAVFVKKINMPILNRTELSKMLAEEMVLHIPYAKDEVEIDYEIVVPKNDQDQMEILLVAAKKEVIDDYMDLVTQAGLNPVVLDITAFAVQNIYQKLMSLGEDETVVILNIGASSTSISIVIGGVTNTVRDVSSGGDSITSEIKRSLQLITEEAEAKKYEVSDGTSTDPALMQVINDVCDNMAQEFQRSIDFVLSNVKITEKVKIVVTGGGANMKPLIHAIEKRSNMPVEIFDGFSGGIHVDSSKFEMSHIHSQATTASVALGLALRKAGDKR
jgi:type IV pilus assembly protein PilM